ncbi:hypothetical protein [Cryptosporangium minutisporangium]|uniref:Uncharacterized protein n=1 Tax=Cryptosporangium minutisporangium TaxID=113569 RepID=A0ABP6SQW9_9ACTN
MIPDLDEAVGGPPGGQDPVHARIVLDLVPSVPALTWGRDELGAGEMWNSNSLIAWLLAASDHDTDALTPPTGGRAPGWRAGLVLAERQPVNPLGHRRSAGLGSFLDIDGRYRLDAQKRVQSAANRLVCS